MMYYTDAMRIQSFSPKPQLAILIIVAAVFMVYLNALRNDFVFDDKFLCVENEIIRDVKNIPKIFGSEFQISETNTGFYRPLVILSLLVDYQIWGLTSVGFHLTNIILHLLTVILIYFFVLNLFKDGRVSFWASLLFAIHPVHASNIAWISGRGDVLCALFYMLSLFLFIKSGKSVLYFLGSLISFFFALISKEMAASLPLIIALYLFCFQEKEEGKSRWPGFLQQCLPYFLVLFVYFLIRAFVIGQAIKHVLIAEELPYRMMTMADVVVKYIGLLIFPAQLNIFYLTSLITTIINSQFIFAAFLIVTILVIAIKLYNRHRGIFFAVFWFFITLIPISNIIPLPLTMMTEYWIYIPSIGFCILIGLIVIKITLWQRGAFLLLCGFLLAGSLTIISINRTWRNELIFYTRMTTYAPQYFLGHYNLGNAYFKMSKNDLAIQEYKKAIELNPDYMSTYINLGGVYNIQHSFDEAIALFKKALEINPDDKEAKANILIAEENKKKFEGKPVKSMEEIEAQIQETVAKKPDDPNTLNNAGVIYAQKGQVDKALEYFEKAASFKPNDINIYINLGNAYAVKGLTEKAVEAFNLALEKDPKDQRAQKALEQLQKK